MSNQKTGTQTDLSGLVEGIVSDVERLLGRQFDLLRAELKREVTRAKDAALSIGAGAGLAAAGGILSTVMVVQMVHSLTRLPLWVCYGLVAAGLGAGGAALMATGVKKAADVQLFPPPHTAEVLREEVNALRG